MSKTLLCAAFCAMVLTAGCAAVPEDNVEEARRALAPEGRLRVALFEGNPTHAVKRPSGDTVGVAHDVGQALATRLGVGFVPVAYTGLAKLLDGGKAGEWDVAFLGVSEERRALFDFTADYIGVEIGYVAAPATRVRTMAEVDTAGVRVAVVDRGSPQALLQPLLKRASLVAAPALGSAIELVSSGRAEVFAGQKPTVYGVAARIPGSRVLEGAPAHEFAALAVPRGRNPAGLAFARRFIEQAKADGTVRAAIERAGLKGVAVAAAR